MKMKSGGAIGGPSLARLGHYCLRTIGYSPSPPCGSSSTRDRSTSRCAATTHSSICWETLLGLLIPYNQAWAHRAAALIFVVSQRHRLRSNGELEDIYSHSFDAGAAWGYLALQTHRLGWAAHGMTGFDHDGCYAAMGVPPGDYRVEAAIAIGRPADKRVPPESYQAREAPSHREPVAGLVFEGRFRP
jgi:nitroreductase